MVNPYEFIFVERWKFNWWILRNTFGFIGARTSQIFIRSNTECRKRQKTITIKRRKTKTDRMKQRLQNNKMHKIVKRKSRMWSTKGETITAVKPNLMGQLSPPKKYGFTKLFFFNLVPALFHYLPSGLVTYININTFFVCV